MVDGSDALVVFQDKAIRRMFHKGEWYFSVVDVVEALTDSPSPRQYWGVLKGRESQLLTLCLQLKLVSSDGKFSMLGERATTEIARTKDAQGFVENKDAARTGGGIAGDARMRTIWMLLKESRS